MLALRRLAVLMLYDTASLNLPRSPRLNLEFTRQVGFGFEI